ncbi:uncharacterized protein TrAtP1_000947 [Trichoderma atroviride]|uniref:uncharacterized protein n=1 Tax=Hypocrea atroviridis TaxID=63577 RepID=UPI00331B6DF9|nr:hypothetical protein TrAtP1_000947 [Trichoderma atroviride]
MPCLILSPGDQVRVAPPSHASPRHIRLGPRSNWSSPTVNPRFEQRGDDMSGELPGDARTEHGVSSMLFQRAPFAGSGPVAIGHATARTPVLLTNCQQSSPGIERYTTCCSLCIDLMYRKPRHGQIARSTRVSEEAGRVCDAGPGWASEDERLPRRACIDHGHV